MSDAEVADLLVKLGFCRQSSNLYTYLLLHGPLSLSDIVAQLGISEDQALSLLGKLIAAMLVFEDSGSYWVLNPKKSFKAFASEALWAEASTLVEGVDDVPDDKQDYVEAVREICRQLQSTASQLYTHRSPIAVGRIKVARNPDQLVALLAEAIDSAKDEILCVSTSPRHQQLAVIWGSLTSRISQGVKYTRIVDLTEIIEHGFAIVQRDVQEVGVNLSIIERERIDSKFYVVDDDFVVMFAPDKYSARDFTLTGQVISNKVIIAKYRNMFNALLEEAIPASFVTSLMAEEKQLLLARASTMLPPTDARWIECLIDYGRYCKFTELDSSQMELAVKRAQEAGLVDLYPMRNGVLFPLPRYSWSVETIRSRWTVEQSSSVSAFVPECMEAN